MQQALAAISRLPPESQNDVARLMLALVDEVPTPLSRDEAAAIQEAEAQMARGQRVPSETIRRFWRMSQ
jgi:hypothetical protein